MDLHLQGIPCCLLVLLTGAASQTIIYPFVFTCAVRGSSITLPCTFTHLTKTDYRGRMVHLKVNRVVWCKNHEICQGTTPSVYDSNAAGDPRFQYQGDKQSVCTLQINNIRRTDKAIYRFRMEMNYTRGHFTNMTGVDVDVIENPKPMEISSSNDDAVVEGGGTVTLRCTSNCTFDRLNVSWFRDDLALLEAGPTLQVGPLTAKDSGNYTCHLKGKKETMSRPLSLKVVENSGVPLPLVVGVACGVLLTAALTALFCFITSRRKRAAAEAASVVEGGAEQGLEELYSSVPSDQQPAGNNQEVEDVSYAAVQFKHQQARRAKDNEDAVIYSSVVGRGLT